jgi:hypothetical protein
MAGFGRVMPVLFCFSPFQFSVLFCFSATNQVGNGSPALAGQLSSSCPQAFCRDSVALPWRWSGLHWTSREWTAIAGFTFREWPGNLLSGGMHAQSVDRLARMVIGTGGSFREPE